MTTTTTMIIKRAIIMTMTMTGDHDVTTNMTMAMTIKMTICMTVTISMPMLVPVRISGQLWLGL